MKTIYLNWYGPFTYDDISNGRHCAERYTKCLEGNGLYAITGKEKYKHNASLQYIGITTQAYVKRFYNHHKLDKINRDVKIWLGNLSSLRTTTKRHLEDVEYILVYFNDASYLNERKITQAPNFDYAVISKFFKKDGISPYKNVPAIVRDIPEVLIWNHGVKELRYCRKLTTFTPE